MSTKKPVQKQELAKHQEVHEDDTITIPVMEIFRQLKKYLLIWIVLAVVAALLVFGGTVAVTASKATPLTAMVGFTYDGIEEGLDPNGDEFDANSIKTPTVIQQTLQDMDMDLELVDTVRSNLVISGVVPSDTIDQITAYQSIFEANNSIDAAKQLMSVSYYPTSFEITFSYKGTGMSRSQAADFLNTLLSNYKVYFMQMYGYNNAFGDALTAVDYTGYDYPQALDVLNSSLDSLDSYISNLSNIDTTRFRSTNTGCTFADLDEAVSTMKSVDYATLASYIYGNNVTKDKTALLTYYQYQIDDLTRSKQSAEEKLASIVDSIANYQKDAMVVSIASDGSSSTISQPSDAYDDLITQKTTAQSNVSYYTKEINTYQTRLDALKKANLCSAAEKEEVETQLASLCESVNSLIAKVNDTADDFFETVSYANAYSVLVPASGSVSSSVSNAVSSMQRPLLVVEAVILVLYLCFAVVRAFVLSYRREQLALVEDVEEEETTETKEIEKKAE